MDYKIALPSKPKVVFEEGNKGVYEISGLYAGYGHTLGNSIRRIILSSIPGAGITSVKIGGVAHEFSKISGIKEDVITILLNLKKIRFKMNVDEPQILKISASGVTDVTAKDIKSPSQVEVLDKSGHIAMLTAKDSILNVEFTVEKGLGYVSREELKKDKVDIGTIVLDAVFTPIRKVNYEVENMRVGDRTDYNKLRIFIETDGSVEPAEALRQAIEIMIKHLRVVIDFQEEPEEKEEIASGNKDRKESKKALKSKNFSTKDEDSRSEKSEESEDGDKEVFKTRVQDLELSSRTLNILELAGIRTLGGLIRKKESDLMEIEGIGKKAVQEINQALGKYELALK